MGFRGLPSPHILSECIHQCMWEGGRKPKFLSQYLPKIEVCSADYPNSSLRQLPSASVGFRGLSSPHILLECRQQCIWEGGRKPKFPRQYLPKIEVRSAVYPNFSLNQLPWASAGYHLLIYCWDAGNNVCAMGPGAKVPEPIFT